MAVAIGDCSLVAAGLTLLLTSAVALAGKNSNTEGLGRSPVLDSSYSRPGNSSGDDSHLPMGFRYRLRPKGQTRLGWHLRKEATSVLAVGSFYVGAYAVQRLLPDYVANVAPVLLNGAGVMLDYLTSQDSTDFGFRLGMRSIPFLASLATNRSLFSVSNPFLEVLILEIPSAIQGLSEYIRQSNRYIAGEDAMLPGSEFDQQYFRVFYSAENEPRIKIRFKGVPSESLQECTSLDENKAVHPELMKLSCYAQKHQINHLEMVPLHYRGNQLVATFRKADGSRFGFTIKYPDTPSRLSWLTDALRLNSAVRGLKPVLSPLSQCVVNELGELLGANADGDFAENTEIESKCADLQVSVLSTKNLMVFPFGGRGYLLVDHGISQGLRTPHIWFNSTVDTQQMTQEWLGALEDDLMPCPERGVWRAASVLRSIVTRVAARYGISWLMGLKQAPRAAAATPEPAPARVRHLSLSLNDIENRLATPEGRAEFLAGIPEDAEVILIRGEREVVNRVLRSALRGDESLSEIVERQSNGLVHTFAPTRASTFYIEVPSFYHPSINMLEAQSREGFQEVLRMLINRAQQFVGVHNIATLFTGYTSIIGDVVSFRQSVAALAIVEFVYDPLRGDEGGTYFANRVQGGVLSTIYQSFDMLPNFTMRRVHRNGLR